MRSCHLNHVVEDEVCENGESVGPHTDGVVVESGVHARCPRLHCVGEPERHVTQSYDQVGSDDWLHRPLEDSEQQLEVTLTELAGDQHEFGQGETGAGPEVGVRELVGVGADVEDERSEGGQESVPVQDFLLADLKDSEDRDDFKLFLVLHF